MRRGLTLLAALLLSLCLSGIAGSSEDAAVVRRVHHPTAFPSTANHNERAGPDTLWIFDADFEDLVGDNAGWTASDRSGTLGQENYWHHDTIRIRDFSWLGDSTWWCGTYDPCWLQSRGYGNDWYQILERDFPEVALGSAPGDELELIWDQRFAMEHDYDYGYIDISEDDGATWSTLHFVHNYGFAGQPGRGSDWDDAMYAHVELDLSAYAGIPFRLRFRFESDASYSAQDQYNNPPMNSVQDGAWQLDNITFLKNGEDTLFYDDCESGNLGWIHDDIPATGQTGVTFRRGQYSIDFVSGRFSCDEPPFGTWMYGAVDSVTGTMVDGQYSWLMSPPIDIAGADNLVASWSFWLDMPEASEDIFNLFLSSPDEQGCVHYPDSYFDEEPGWWHGGPGWYVSTDDWSAYAGNDWLGILWAIQNFEPAPEHRAGFLLDRHRVGIVQGDVGTALERHAWRRFNDWFGEELSDALLDSAQIRVTDADGVLSVHLVVRSNLAPVWESYLCRRMNAQWWVVPPPWNHMIPGSEIHYYYEATDSLGTTAVLPEGAPDETFEMSILPITGSVSEPGILLVDKHGQPTPGDDRSLRAPSETAYREALDILGYEYDVYDVELPGSETDLADGPDSSGMKYYDTQIWFAGDLRSATVTPADQANLIHWLDRAGEGKDRNLLLTGENIGYELAGTAFYDTWLATDFVADDVGAVTVDSVPGLADDGSGWTFMDHDDALAALAGGCPLPASFDVVQPGDGMTGAETVAEYVKLDASRLPAGAAYTHATEGYRTVTLGFPMERMVGSTSGPSGTYPPGADDRVNLLENIMAYFAKSPTASGTDVVQGRRNALSHAHPNPFNPVTKIRFSLSEPGHVTIRVHDVSGRVVRTLIDETVASPGPGSVVWDGRDERGQRCASGVYFYRLEAPAFRTERRMVLLR